MARLTRRLRIGVHTPTQHSDIAALIDVWSRVDELGFDWVSVWDHLQPVDGEGPSVDAVAAHTALAAVTSSVQVGCLVYCVGYHNPASLALAATSIDHISNGRAVIGLGAGYLEAEYRRFGFAFEAPGDRVRRLESFVTAIRALLDGETVTRSDGFIELRDAMIGPRPVQSRLPIWIGGGGEQRTLPLAGRLADGWNIAMATASDFERKNRIVTGAAEAAGRDPASIERSVNLGLCFDEQELPARFGPRWEQLAPAVLTGSDDQILERLASYSAAGATRVMLSMRAPIRVDDVERFAADILARLP